MKNARMGIIGAILGSNPGVAFVVKRSPYTSALNPNDNCWPYYENKLSVGRVLVTFPVIMVQQLKQPISFLVELTPSIGGKYLLLSV